VPSLSVSYDQDYGFVRFLYIDYDVSRLSDDIQITAEEYVATCSDGDGSEQFADALLDRGEADAPGLGRGHGVEHGLVGLERCGEFGRDGRQAGQRFSGCNVVDVDVPADDGFGERDDLRPCPGLGTAEHEQRV